MPRRSKYIKQFRGEIEKYTAQHNNNSRKVLDCKIKSRVIGSMVNARKQWEKDGAREICLQCGTTTKKEIKRR